MTLCYLNKNNTILLNNDYRKWLYISTNRQWIFFECCNLFLTNTRITVLCRVELVFFLTLMLLHKFKTQLCIYAVLKWFYQLWNYQMLNSNFIFVAFATFVWKNFCRSHCGDSENVIKNIPKISFIYLYSHAFGISVGYAETITRHFAIVTNVSWLTCITFAFLRPSSSNIGSIHFFYQPTSALCA